MTWATEVDWYLENRLTPDELDTLSAQTIGLTWSSLAFHYFPEDSQTLKILEVGCGEGGKLQLLHDMGYSDLHGCDVNHSALDELTHHVDATIQQADLLEGLPYEDNEFDLVFTAGTLIHIPPNEIDEALREIERVSDQWIWGYEYWEERLTEVPWREGLRLWKGPYAEHYLHAVPTLRLAKYERLPHIDNPTLQDCVFLLEKR